MNLHDVVRGAITAVNPDQKVIWLASTGQSVDENYTQIPTWAPAVEVTAQIQPVPDSSLQWLQQTRQNGIWRNCYLNGAVNGLERATAKGGDMLYFEGYEWQVDQVSGAWDATAGWSKVLVVQIRAVAPPAIGATERPGEDSEWPG